MTRTPPGSLLVCLLGAILGAAVAETLRYAALRTGALGTPVSIPVAFLAGAATGFVITGLVVGNRLVERSLATAGRVLAVVAGSGAGLALGLGAYIAIWAWLHPDQPALGAFAGWQDHLGRPDDALTILALGGLLSGLAGATYLVGRGRFRQGVGLVGGILAGLLAGAFAYSVGIALTQPLADPGAAGFALAMAMAATTGGVVEALFLGLGAYIGAAVSGYRWRVYGLLTFLSLLFVVLGYVLYALLVTLPSVPAETKGLSIVLFVAEGCSLAMVLVYSFYTIDVAARKRWGRTRENSVFSPFYLPKVALQVPTYNEPPEMVIESLRRLLALDYPADRFTIVVGDDSTRPECSEPVREFCRANGIAYLHRQDRTGYKAGVLNALLSWIPPDYTLLAVVDADYHVEPEFLRETVGYFVDPSLGWLQTPQDYRNRHQSFLTEQYYLADSYFYRTILPSRNEENSILFCGTMGLLRRRALLDVGGWAEAHVTEDAELSLRLLNTGWKSLYLNTTYGRGLIPATFDGYKRQHYRWAFGGGRILRGHGLRLLFGRFTFRQRMDHLVGTVHWLEGAFILAIALFVLGFGLADVLGLEVFTHHHGEVLLIGLVPLLLLLDGLGRVHLVLRRSVKLGFGGTLRLLGMWSSVKFSNMRAALKGLLGFHIPFIRTPKFAPDGLTKGAAFRLALRLTRFESTLAALLAFTAFALAAKLAIVSWDASSPGRLLLTFWLSYYVLVFGSAPLYAYKSFSTLHPDEDGADPAALQIREWPVAAQPPTGAEPPEPLVEFQGMADAFARESRGPAEP